MLETMIGAVGPRLLASSSSGTSSSANLLLPNGKNSMTIASGRSERKVSRDGPEPKRPGALEADPPIVTDEASVDPSPDG
jgi:hypothetical protein